LDISSHSQKKRNPTCRMAHLFFPFDRAVRAYSCFFLLTPSSTRDSHRDSRFFVRSFVRTSIGPPFPLVATSQRLPVFLECIPSSSSRQGMRRPYRLPSFPGHTLSSVLHTPRPHSRFPIADKTARDGWLRSFVDPIPLTCPFLKALTFFPAYSVSGPPSLFEGKTC